jgi:D-glycero-beta-D-manno-heptose 1-phosphate adenylyltransferase
MVLSEQQLIDAVARDRAAGRTIALANGCFDLLHVGHVRYLQGAAAEAARLIVAVNDDRSVAALKGEGRPILNAADRAELVAAVRGVDYVVIFSEPDVARLLTIVRAYGGRTAIVGDDKRHSTRDIITRLTRG